MGSAFEQATAVEQIGEGRYRGAIAAGWDIGGNANGGYLTALAARAMSEAVGRPPLSITTHYLAPGPVGDAIVDVTVVRDGRRTAVVRATMTVDDRPIVTLLGTFAPFVDHDESAPSYDSSAPPELPPIDECVRRGPPVESGFGMRVSNLYHPDDAGFAVGQKSGRPLARGWFEFADHAPVDEFGLLLVADAFAPVCFNVHDVPVSWAPTLELTTHIRAAPAEGPLRARFESRHLRDGYFEEDGEIWDSTGLLVAQSRQIALVPR